VAKKACTCQQTPADPERRWVGDACLCEAKAMTWEYEGVTCDEQGQPRGKLSHRIVCDEGGAHVFPGTCFALMGGDSMTISLEQAGPLHATRPCKVCHPAESER